MFDLRFCLLAASVVMIGLLPNPAIAGPKSPGAGAAQAFVKAPPGFREACRRYDWLCSGGSDAARAFEFDALLDLARSVNRRVNRMVSPLTDSENYGVADRWALPTNGYGDCEDYVLLKYQKLLEAGVHRRHLSIAVVVNLAGENHAVLVLRHEAGDYVLDSLTSRIRPWNETGYRFLAMQSGADATAWAIVDRRSGEGHLIALR